VSRIALWQALACALFLLSGSALAEPPSAAREHFAHGVEQAGLGDFNSAAANFEEAYRLSPHYAVQYNLGQAYAALGKSVEAVHAFEKYLEGGARKISPQRQNDVRQLILSLKRRIGYVALEIDPPEAQLFIDGRAIEAATPGVPIPLSVGVHGVALTLAGYRAFVGSVTVESQKTVRVEARLERTPAPSPVERIAVGQVAVDSSLPELTVSLDGTSLNHVSNDPFLVPLGSHRIRCTRVGYEPIEVQVEAHEHAVARVNCDLTPRVKAPPSDTGLVSFQVDPLDAEISIDGRRASHSARLPRGLHTVRVRRWGFVDWTRTITLRPGFPETIVVQLKPTPEHALELARAARKRRTLAYVIGGTGLALLGTSAVLYATNNQRYANWTASNDSSSPDLQTALSIQRQDFAALTTAVAGGLMLGYAAITWSGSK